MMFCKWFSFSWTCSRLFSPSFIRRFPKPHASSGGDGTVRPQMPWILPEARHEEFIQGIGEKMVKAKVEEAFPSLWFQPIWKIWASQIGSFPLVAWVKINNVWNHNLISFGNMQYATNNTVIYTCLSHQKCVLWTSRPRWVFLKHTNLQNTQPAQNNGCWFFSEIRRMSQTSYRYENPSNNSGL